MVGAMFRIWGGVIVLFSAVMIFTADRGEAGGPFKGLVVGAVMALMGSIFGGSKGTRL